MSDVVLPRDENTDETVTIPREEVERVLRYGSEANETAETSAPALKRRSPDGPEEEETEEEGPAHFETESQTRRQRRRYTAPQPPPPPVAPFFNFLQNPVEKFSGSDSEDAELWLENFEQIAEGAHWNDGTKCWQLASALSGKAKRWIQACPPDIRKYWFGLRREFRKTFAPEDTQYYYQMLRNRSQGPEDDILDYAYEIKSLINRTNPLMPGPQQVAELIGGLQPSWAKYLLTKKPSNMDAAFELIQNRQRVEKQVKQRKETKSEDPSETKKTDSGSEKWEKELTALKEAVNKVSESSLARVHRLEEEVNRNRNERFSRERFTGPPARSYPPKPVRCYNCQKLGHRAMDCRTRMTQPGSSYRPRNNQGFRNQQSSKLPDFQFRSRNNNMTNTFRNNPQYNNNNDGKGFRNNNQRNFRQN